MVQQAMVANTMIWWGKKMFEKGKRKHKEKEMKKK
jgi:hypothetical protein